jgi:hypothetical protein
MEGSVEDWRMGAMQEGFALGELRSPTLLFPRLKQLSVEPYSQEEAERAAGMGSYVQPQRLGVPTEVSTDIPEMDTST